MKEKIYISFVKYVIIALIRLAKSVHEGTKKFNDEILLRKITKQSK